MNFFHILLIIGNLQPFKEIGRNKENLFEASWAHLKKSANSDT